MPYLIGLSDSVNGVLFHLREGDNWFRKNSLKKWFLSEPGQKSSDLRFSVKKDRCLFESPSGKETWLNGKPVTSGNLHDADVIETDQDVFRFLTDDQAIVELNDGTILLCDTDCFVIDQKNEHQNFSGQQDGNERDSFIPDWGAFTDKEALLKALKTVLLRYFPEARMLVFLRNELRGCYEKALEHSPFSGEVFHVSRTLFSGVLSEKKAVLSQDILKDVRFKGSQSLHGQSVQSVMCAPFLQGDLIPGFVYMDYCEPGKEFSKKDFSFFLQILNPVSAAVSSLLFRERLLGENRALRAALLEERPFIGKSPPVMKVFENILKVAKTDLTVLIRGETGTGKELAARMLHEHSPRSSFPMTTIHCAMLSETLLESELFGHEKGAFTGATEARKGKLEQSQGTLFLDEIGEISPGVQVKLLRFLQEKEFERVGGNKKIKVDVRIVAATNRDLEKAVREGTFREDLYYRLKGFQLRLPPLRDRREDIPELVDFFIRKYCLENNRSLPEISDNALCLLKSADWPGNVRELKHALEQALVLCSSSCLEAQDFDLEKNEEKTAAFSTGSSDAPLAFKEALARFEKGYLEELLAKTGGNISLAARISGLDRSYLHLKLKKSGIDSFLFRK